MKVEFHGDSTQVGVSVWGSTFQNPWPAWKCFDMLALYNHGPGTVVVPLGVGGSTVNSALTTPIYPGGRNFSQHIAQSDADIVVCNWAINDCFTPNYTSTNHKNAYINLKSIVEQNGKIFIAETSNPVTYDWPARNDLLAGFNSAVKTIPGIKVIDPFSAVLQWYPNWKDHMDGSGVHPNGIMYKFIGDIVYNGLRSYL